MKAVILAGGLGSRLKPFTNIIPKPLIPICGEQTVLEILLVNLKKNGFEEIFIATNYKAEMIESYLGDGSKYGVRLTFSKEQQPLGTCGPLNLLKEHLHEPFLLMNGDILTEMDLSKLYDVSVGNESMLTVVTKELTRPLDFGNVIIENGFITNIEEKPKIKFIIVTGIYVLKPEVFDFIPDGIYFGIDDLMQTLLEKNLPISSYFTNEYWVDIGRIDDLEDVRKRFEQ